MKYFLFFILSIFLISCVSDDDICVSGEATPRMQLKFLTDEGKPKTLDSLYVSVEYASGKSLIVKQRNSDSVLIPLRVDEQEFTDIYIKQRTHGEESKIRINYTTKSEYVSPACGIKKTYENVEGELLKTNPVNTIEQNQNQIINEDKTHFYLIF